MGSVQTLTHVRPAGWDPIFEYQGTTYAEMDKEAKVRNEELLILVPPLWFVNYPEQNQVSHRYKALVKLQHWLAEEQP